MLYGLISIIHNDNRSTRHQSTSGLDSMLTT